MCMDGLGGVLCQLFLYLSPSILIIISLVPWSMLNEATLNSSAQTMCTIAVNVYMVCSLHAFNRPSDWLPDEQMNDWINSYNNCRCGRIGNGAKNCDMNWLWKQTTFFYQWHTAGVCVREAYLSQGLRFKQGDDSNKDNGNDDDNNEYKE